MTIHLLTLLFKAFVVKELKESVTKHFVNQVDHSYLNFIPINILTPIQIQIQILNSEIKVILKIIMNRITMSDNQD